MVVERVEWEEETRKDCARGRGRRRRGEEGEGEEEWRDRERKVEGEEEDEGDVCWNEREGKDAVAFEFFGGIRLLRGYL